MVDRIELVQNDTGPQIQLTLNDSFTGLPLNLTGATLVLHFALPGAAVPKAIIPLTLGPSAALGQCLLNWPVGALDTAGHYVGEVQITWAGGGIQTTPTKLKFRVRAELG